MLFNSPEFLIFFIAITGIYFRIPHKFRWILLLSGSYYFYMCWRPEYVLLIIVSTIVDYIAGLRMGRCSHKKQRTKYLVLSLLVNLGLLFYFKYFNFFAGTFESVYGIFGNGLDIPMANILLPVGISFYTFQTLSYTIDVYRGKRQPEKHLGIFAVYVTFFPQLVAGPIERSTNLIPQFHKVASPDLNRIIRGTGQILLGFFKKVVIADRLAIAVDTVYANPADHTGIQHLTATVFFAFQIYCDFSGYSDIAIGSARILGIDLMQNFRYPYLSRSIAEFWKRWHISLSTWFKDYFYIALGGNRVVKWRWYYNLMLTFLVSGLWHGASWNFVIWGGLNGFFLIFAILTKEIRGNLWSKTGLAQVSGIKYFVQIMATFGLTCFAWIFFRAESFSDAYYIISSILDSLLRLRFENIESVIIGIGMNRTEFAISCTAILLLELIQYVERNKSTIINKSLNSRGIVFVSYIAIGFLILFFGRFTSQQFIYFQF